MITLNNLTLSYNKQKRKVIHELDLTMKEGLIHGIVGLNGAGKTTLLNALFGLKKVDGGTIQRNKRALNKSEVAYLVTENYFYANITGREYLGLFKNPDFDTDAWNRLFLLPLDEVVDNYSTGMKKKLALMGILKQDKPLMILDEPFNGLDMETCRIMRMILLRLREKQKTIVVTSHIMETLTNLCDCIHYLEDGKIQYNKERAAFADLERTVFASIEARHGELIDKLTQ